MSLLHGPDISSSEDEFDDPEFRDLIKQRRLDRIQNPVLTENQIKEQRQKRIQMFIITRNNEGVLEEINNGLNLNERLEDDFTLISLAASIANYELVVKLFEMGADISLKKGTDTILMSACNCPASKATFEASSKVVEFLIEKGVDVKATNRRRMNALMFAASNGNLNAVELLIPHCDLNETDNQDWNVLFWAVYSGNAELVKYLIDQGMPTDKTDIRGNIPLDVAVDHNHKDVIKLLNPEEEETDNINLISGTNFEDIFSSLKEDEERPAFLQDIYNILQGTRCENLVKLFVDQNVNLIQFLSSSNEDFKDLGVGMPFQRRRLLAGIHRFHKTPFHPNSIPRVGKNEIYSNIDVASAVLSAMKQFICMEAAFKYIMKNAENLDSLQDRKVIERVFFSIEMKLRRLRKVTTKLHVRAVEWDHQIKPVNIITSKSGKRWFPWRKAVAIIGIAAIISLKIWKIPSQVLS